MSLRLRSGTSPDMEPKLFRVKRQTVRSVGIVDGREAEAFVEAGCTGILSTQAHAVKMLAGSLKQPEDEGSPDTLVAPGWADKDAPDTAGGGIVEKRIERETANGDQQSPIDDTAEHFARGIEAVFAGRPLSDQFVDEEIAFTARLGGELLDAGNGQLNFANSGHALRSGYARSR